MIGAGLKEPHSELLDQPSDDAMLYKVMSIENFERSLTGGYLYFTRVDDYTDDRADGKQPPLDSVQDGLTHFESAPSYSLSAYYDKCRSRTYACCFSVEDSLTIWTTYGVSPGSSGQVSIAVRFDVLRERVNAAFDKIVGTTVVESDFLLHTLSVNYGLARYVDVASYITNGYAANPIEYAHLKDLAYAHDRELRVSLSALGMVNFLLPSGEMLDFPRKLCYPFDLRAALMDRAMRLRVKSTEDRVALEGVLDKAGVSVDDYLEG